jgi:hypothetical protein
MSQIEYDTIAPNIANVSVDGSNVRVTWRDPDTGRIVGESAATMSADYSMGGKVQSTIKRSIVSEVSSGAARFLGGLLGGAAGRVVRDAAYTASSDVQSRASSAAQYTEASKRAAIVSAFASVQNNFTWSHEKQRFVAR